MRKIMERTSRLLKLCKLDYLDERDVAVAFSGGVDSSFLLWVLAKRENRGRLYAITAASPLTPVRETAQAEAFCRDLGVPQITFSFDPMDPSDPACYVPEFADNPGDRCYLCKRQLFNRIKDLAMAQGVKVIVDGTNADDEGDYRPGIRALQELGIRSPLKDAGFTKQEIRRLLYEAGLPIYAKPSQACLATRFPYGERITREGLARVGAAEEFLRDMGFTQVRVRVHGKNLARIELQPEQFPKMLEESLRLEVIEKLNEYGFTYISMDLSGYRTGSMNETVSKKSI